MKRIVAIFLAMLALLCAQPAAMAEASVASSFNITQAEKDGFHISTNANTESIFITTDHYRTFNTPYDVSGYNSYIESDIIVLKDTGTPRMRTYIYFISNNPLSIQSVSFVIGPNEYELIQHNNINSPIDHGEYWKEGICFLYGSNNMEFLTVLEAAYGDFTTDELNSMTIPMIVQAENTTFSIDISATAVSDILTMYHAMNAYGGTFRKSNTELIIRPARPTPTSKPAPAPTPAPSDETFFDGLTETQRDSISMLNYLTVLSQEIASSKNSLLFLESAYSSIFNNINPSAVDSRTLTELNTLLDTLERYRMIAVKRDRLQYIYDRNMAKALKSAIPSPLYFIQSLQSGSVMKALAAAVSTAKDAFSNYQAAASAAELQYLQSSWSLDDEQASALHLQRKSTFNYMVQTVNANSLPGNLALTENAVQTLVDWQNNTNVESRISFLRSKEDVYQAFGGYWLLLAKSYYENTNYSMCLYAVKRYEALGIKLFRYDYDFAEVLPLAIVSAEDVYPTAEYTVLAADYAAKIIRNTTEKQWALRYFAAQTYVDIYAKTGDIAYLNQAYSIVHANVNSLVQEQRALNAAYLSPVAEVKPAADATKAEKKEISNYNKMLKEIRKTELPPILEPLYLNCELLFAIAEKLNISPEEQASIDRILHENGDDLFLVKQIDNQFRFNASAIDTSSSRFLSYDRGRFYLPVRYFSSDMTIEVFASEASNTDTYDVYDMNTPIDDWQFTAATRDSYSNDLDNIYACFSSATAKDLFYLPGTHFTVHVKPGNRLNAQELVFEFEFTIEFGFLGFPLSNYARIK